MKKRLLMAVRYIPCLVCVVFICGFGCAKKIQDISAEKIEKIERQSDKTEDDRRDNGVLITGWNIGISDGDIDNWKSSVFATANYNCKMSIPARLRNDFSLQLEVLIVPDFSGYKVVILSRRRLEDAERNSLRTIVETALSDAKAEVASKKK